MTPWTKRRPLASRPRPASELDGALNAHLLRVYLLEPLQLLLCLFVVKAFTLQMRVRTCQLRLRIFVVQFRLRREVERKRKTLAQYVRYRQVFQGVAGDVQEAHVGGGVVMPNDPSSATRPTGGAS